MGAPDVRELCRGVMSGCLRVSRRTGLGCDQGEQNDAGRLAEALGDATGQRLTDDEPIGKALRKRLSLRPETRPKGPLPAGSLVMEGL